MKTNVAPIFLLIALVLTVGNVRGQYTWKGITTPVPMQALDSGYTTWQWLNPLPQGNILGDCWLLDSNTLVASGEGGTVVRTTNGGLNWSVQQKVAGCKSLWDIMFTDSVNGFAVGDGILKTTDRGSTWIPKVLGNPYRQMYALSFLGDDTAMAVGVNGTMYRTIDSGENWEYMHAGDSVILRDICLVDPNNFLAVGETYGTWKGYLFRSTDAGGTWTSQSFSDSSFIPFGITFITPQTGFIVGTLVDPLNLQYDVILRTSDGGASWSPVWKKSFQFGSHEIMFSDTLHGIAVGENGEILRTSNGGSTWSEQTSGVQRSLYGLNVLDGQQSAAVGEGGMLLRSTDGGTTWTNLTQGTTEALRGVQFTSPTTGYVAGWNDVLLRSSDGGTHWENVFRFSDNLNGLSFIDDSNGTAVGIYIYNTTDAGTTWTRNIPPAISWLNDICYAGKDTGYIVGQNGIILQSTTWNGSWTQQSSGTTGILNGVHFTDGRHGAVVGNGGLILRTTDAGANWTSQTSGITHSLMDVFFTDETTGVAVSDVGTDGHSHILKTTDGGTNWTDAVSPIYQTGLTSLQFVDRNTGFAGGYGLVLRTIDAGLSWHEWETPGDVRDVNFVQSGAGLVGYTVGRGGGILVAAVSPLNPKTWTWTGVVDSSWNTVGNWSPIGVPLPGDSVIIPPATHSPITDVVQQQITVASVNILTGGQLTMTEALGRFVVLGDVIIDGTLEVRPPAATVIVVGGNWLVSAGGTARPEALDRATAASAAANGFLPYRSKVIFTGSGIMAGRFYDLVYDTTSSMKSNGTGVKLTTG